MNEGRAHHQQFIVIYLEILHLEHYQSPLKKNCLCIT